MDEKPIGQVNYKGIDPSYNSTELDIIIANEANMFRGYGSDALSALARYLFEKMGARLCWIEPIEENPRAIRSYEKAGLKETRSFIKDGLKIIHLEKASGCDA